MTSPDHTYRKEDLEDEMISSDDYIKSSIEAGNRVRAIVYLMTFASIISFISFWNASGTSWINDRFATIYEADEHYLKDTVSLTHPIPCPRYTKKDSVRLYTFLQHYEINTPSKLNAYKKIFTDLEENIYSVKVPILGVNFDINDLSLLSGLTFFFLFLLLRLSIEREKENVTITFGYAEKTKRLEKTYNYMAMGQVLSDPPKLIPAPITAKRRFFKGFIRAHPKKTEHSDVQKPTFVWIRRHIAKLLFIVPLVSHLFILLNDFKTILNGTVLSSGSTYTVLIAGVFLFLLNTILTIMCISIKVNIDKIWEIYYIKIIPKIH